jgi:dienelactone hydrolase
MFWRQEPGVDLAVTSEADWQHGLRLYGAYDRDAGAKDVKDTVNAVRNLPECNGKVAVLGYCLGALMVFLTAVRCHGVDAAVAYHGGDTEKYLGEVDGLNAPLLMHLAEEDEFIPSLRKLKSRRHLVRNRTRQSTAIRVRIMPSLGIMAHTTMPPRQRSPTGGQANFYINNCGDFRSLQRLWATRSPSPSVRNGHFRRAEKRSRE